MAMSNYNLDAIVQEIHRLKSIRLMIASDTNKQELCDKITKAIKIYNRFLRGELLDYQLRDLISALNLEDEIDLI